MTEFNVGALIENRYRVLDVIGTGGMGTLYRVSDEARQGEIIALKTVRLRGSAAEATEGVERFQREFQLLTQLRHPNLVSVYDYGITVEGELYFTMEWVEGGDLEPGQRPLEPGATIPVMVRICRALAYLHTRDVIHGDLKPASVLMVNDRIKLVDFGVAHEVRLPEDRARYHTPGYAAPETRQPYPIDHRADLYSLGAMWFALLVGEPPMFMPGLGFSRKINLPSALAGSSDPAAERVKFGYFAHFGPGSPDPGRAKWEVLNSGTPLAKERLIRFALDEALEAQRQIPAVMGAVIARLMATSPADRYSSANKVIEAVNQITGSAYELETRETAASYALRTRFVNREAEIEVLQTVWKEAQNGAGKVVLISGESGVGKTRLVAEMEVQAELEGARVVWGQCVESGGDAYQPWREVLRVLVRYVEGADEGLMQGTGPVLAALLPELWERDYMTDLAPPAQLDPQAAQQRLHRAIVQTLRAAVELRPTMVVIENAQWADEATLSMLSFLTRTIGRTGLLVCVTYRSDEIDIESPLLKMTNDQVLCIPTQTLSPQVTTDLVCAMLGLKELPTLLMEQLQRTTGGNAFFVQELIRSLVVEGEVLRRTVEGWQVDQELLKKVQLPESIRQVVGRRLMQLSTEARQMLGWAAVMGIVCWEGGIAEIGGVSRSQVRAAFRQVSALELLVVRDESSFAGEREYLFLNPTVREVSYESIPGEERQEIHGRVAAWLMARGEEKVSEHLGLIADHLERAGQMEQALVYLRQAGERAAAQFANAEAIAYFSRALDLLLEESLIERFITRHLFRSPSRKLQVSCGQSTKPS